MEDAIFILETMVDPDTNISQEERSAVRWAMQRIQNLESDVQTYKHQVAQERNKNFLMRESLREAARNLDSVSAGLDILVKTK